MVLILVAFAGLVGKVALSTLAAVRVFAAIGSLRPRQLVTIWRTGLCPRRELVSAVLREPSW